VKNVINGLDHARIFKMQMTLHSSIFVELFNVSTSQQRSKGKRAKVSPIEKTDFLSKNIFPLSSEIFVNLFKMKKKNFLGY